MTHPEWPIMDLGTWSPPNLAPNLMIVREESDHRG